MPFKKRQKARKKEENRIEGEILRKRKKEGGKGERERGRK
jgi:hypothetical protein